MIEKIYALDKKDVHSFIFSLLREKIGFVKGYQIDISVPDTIMPSFIIFTKDIKRWLEGECIQNVFSYLTIEQREFLISGTLPELWDKFEENCAKSR